MKIPQWVKGAIQTPGYIKVQLLLLMTLAISSVSSTGLQMSKTEDNTSVENIFGRNESLELLLVLPEGEELHLKVTGRTTMEVLTSLKQMLPNSGRGRLLERSFPYTQHQEESITRRLDNSL